jgi:hypothetical protein
MPEILSYPYPIKNNPYRSTPNHHKSKWWYSHSSRPLIHSTSNSE